MTTNPLDGFDTSMFHLASDDTFGSVLGVEVDSFEPRGPITAHIPVKPVLMQPMGIIHGGIYAPIGESLASIATVMNVIADGMAAVGQSNNTSFLRPVSSGTMHAVGTPLHMGRTSWYWQVEIKDDDGKLCAISMVTLAVRPMASFDRSAKEDTSGSTP